MRIEAVPGDITRQQVDAIVNAANSSLLGGGGVDGAIHRAAGPRLLADCRRVRREKYPAGLPTGDAVATGAGDLAARAVIHTVGPVHAQHPDDGSDLLASCHRRCLEVAEELALQSIAFPAISCGAYGWRATEAAPIAIEAVRRYAAECPQSTIEVVRFVLLDHDARRAFASALE
ncbi:MAG: O-acetyl-ADP-ribose deacetylase [Actinobacteria bacterium]|jgi:O-acetyl-ADP-ribose deacetylase (regulator of RNase III)|nr:O-acetyl-ADP-ribose deacetylase [Actinomycetota bacterium]